MVGTKNPLTLFSINGAAIDVALSRESPLT